MDRSEDRETRCNAIFSFVFIGGIFYHEDEFLRGDGSQGKYHHGVMFLANGVAGDSFMSAGRMGGPAQDKHSGQQICLFF